ncbi:NfeD family protein [Parafrankia discariae]|uniref:NfeD family protein n=1 Tax=Parafrankia discariae TaxID=365528 RepID=UPI000475987E|nr:NfeD family protein [Parafrankia discariae]
MADEVVWIIVAGVLVVGELLTLDLVLVMFALAALVGAGLAVLGADLIVQLVGFAVAAGGLTFGLRPVARRHLTSGPVLRTGTEALAGAPAVVLERVDGTTGRVRLAGEVWSAWAYPATDEFEVGTTVRVLRVDGAHVLVHADAELGDTARRELD